MKKKHHSSLKFHTIYSIILSVVFLAIILVRHDLTLGLTMVFLTLYIVGNGIIHTTKNELKRDTLVEYVLVSIIIMIMTIGAIK